MMAERERVLDLALSHPDLFEVEIRAGEATILVRPEPEGLPCPCCGKPLAGSPLKRAEPR